MINCGRAEKLIRKFINFSADPPVHPHFSSEIYLRLDLRSHVLVKNDLIMPDNAASATVVSRSSLDSEEFRATATRGPLHRRRTFFTGNNLLAAGRPDSSRGIQIRRTRVWVAGDAWVRVKHVTRASIHGGTCVGVYLQASHSLQEVVQLQMHTLEIDFPCHIASTAIFFPFNNPFVIILFIKFRH